MELYKSNFAPHNFTSEDIILYENLFSDMERETIKSYLNRPMWNWGHKSNYDSKSAPFWNMLLNNDKYFTEYLFQKIQAVTGDDLILERCYANGNTFGLPGDIHQDSSSEKAMTFMYYANYDWDERLGGKTAFIFDDETQNKYILPKKGRSVYFPGLIPHYAEEVARLFAGLRVTVVWKMEKR